MATKSHKAKRARAKNQPRRPEDGAGHGPAAAASRRSSPTKLRRRLLAVAIAAAAIGFLALLWWVAGGQQRDFVALAEDGSAAMRQAVRSEPSQGRSHVTGAIDYDHRLPTSGPHNPTWISPGFYDQRQPAERLVHALEHGNIVVYYDEPGEAVLTRLRKWARLYDDRWSGIVVTPAPELGEEIVMTAWTRRLRLEAFEPAVAAAFIDAYRGRGPEHPVR